MQRLSAIAMFLLSLGLLSPGALAYDSGDYGGEPRLTYEKLRQAIETRGMKRIEDVLSWVADRYPAHVERFTLMKQSHSLQDATAQNPRAILFGRTGELIMTFNGSEDQKGYDNLEVIQFRSPEETESGVAAFEFREITFPTQGSTGTVTFSDVNPAKCLRCHYSPPRPIWETYRRWPGAYGENDDGVLNDSEEARLLKKFMEARPSHPRYQYLEPPKGSPSSPYRTERAAPGSLRTRPNLNLTLLLNRLNAIRLKSSVAAAAQKAGSCQERYRNLMALGAFNCHVGVDTPDSIKKVAPVLDEDVKHPENEGSHIRLDPHYARDRVNPLFQMFQLSGFSGYDWSLERHPRSWLFRDGRSTQLDLVGSVMLYDWVQTDERLNEDLPYDSRYAQAEDDERKLEAALRRLVRPLDQKIVWRCEALVEAAMTDFNPGDGERCDPVPAWPDRDGHKTPDVVRACASCHENSSVAAPRLPFSKPRSWSDAQLEAVVDRIDLPLEKPGHMPPDRNLSNREKQALRDYFTIETKP